jgi:hypothetical protein
LQRRQLQQQLQALLQLRGRDGIAVMPVQRGMQMEPPAQAVCAHIPVMCQIALWLNAVTDKTGQAAEDLPGKMLFRASGKKTRNEGIKRAIVGDAQCWRFVLPQAAEKWIQQRAQIVRRNLRQRQGVLLLTAIERLFEHLTAYRFWRDQQL